ncbi:hypothetical protein L211DRAFT_842559 [Terfezia boudieri ATCC MYA-4762]|uniref:Arb2 domain-containing protein n=1 Tax=Terfezia boudieri ATCC MYA-4762 TaxID=1051890 RepID=A0A3N4LDD4_9PEZI|nr:hypothetical protein L211DRAFT_842559 [Terfezia boudieri ATCC MYA-4762]
MFVRRRRDVAEQEYPEDLKELGLFFNDKDELRQIEKPDKTFEYKVSKNQRLNERRREAVVSCFRKLIHERLSALGLRTLKLSQGTHHTHIPILHSADLPQNPEKCLILIPDDNNSLGLWSLRAIDGENGSFRTGSMEAIVSRAISEGYSVIIANSGALIYDPELNTTVPTHSWGAREKPWKLGGRIRQYDPTWNVVAGSEDPEAHIEMVFEKVVKNLVPKTTKIFIAAAGTGAGGLIQYLDRTYSNWASQLQACVFSEPAYSVTALTSPQLRLFLNKLCRTYIVNSEPTGTEVADLRFGCSTFSAATMYTECIIPLLWREIMDYFVLALEDPEWCNPNMVIESQVGGEEGAKEALEKVKLAEGGGKVWGDGSVPGCGW